MLTLSAMTTLEAKQNAATGTGGASTHITMPEPNPDWRARHLELDEGVHPKVAKLAANAEWFTHACLRDIRDHGAWLVIAGRTGCGKTHVAERVARYAGARQIDAWSRGWWQATHIAAPAFLRWEHVGTCRDELWEEILQEIRRARLVVIDDIGAEVDQYKAGVPAERLKLALDAAHGRWLLATTNVNKESWESTWGGRVADRLRQSRYLSLFDVPSYRGRR